MKRFEIVVNEGKPWTIITSYNRINGVHTSVSNDLLVGILRNEWGYDRLIITDWHTFPDILKRIKGGGINVKMPYERRNLVIFKEFKKWKKKETN